MSINAPNIKLPPILGIPNEVLYHILNFLSYLNLDESIVEYQVNDKDYKVSQMIVLRSVCRRFRSMIPELDFWLDTYFDFFRLIPGWYELPADSSFSCHAQERQFLEVLFSDDELVESLGRRKTEWMFQSIEGLQIVMQKIPLFKQNARTISLEIVSDEDDSESEDRFATGTSATGTSLDIAIDMLSACSRITTLCILLADSLNLTKIASSFPFLETLYCSETDHFHGTLQGLTHLQGLYMDTRGDVTTIPWLPLQSTSTLRRLGLTCNPYMSFESFFDAPSLDLFTNLTSLAIRPLSTPVVGFLLRTHCHLETFEISLICHLTPIDTVISVFEAACLGDLKEFRISNLHESTSELDGPELRNVEYYWRLVFDAFTSMLSSVEEVELDDVPLHIECCAYFSRMSKLSFLSWEGSPYPYFGIGTDENPSQKVEKALEKAFSEFVEKPRSAVHFSGS